MKLIILLISILNFYIVVNIFHIINKPEKSCDAEVAAALNAIEPGDTNVEDTKE